MVNTGFPLVAQILLKIWFDVSLNESIFLMITLFVVIHNSSLFCKDVLVGCGCDLLYLYIRIMFFYDFTDKQW